MVKLAHEHQNEGLVTASVSLDAAAEHQTALTFLKENNATFPNFRFKFKDEGEWFDTFKFDSGPPMAIIYDRQGKLVGRFEGIGQKEVHDKMMAALKEALGNK